MDDGYSGPPYTGPRTYNYLLFGGIDRGRCYLKPKDKTVQGVPGKDYSLLPTCYHHPKSPIGIVMQQFQPFHWPDAKNGPGTGGPAKPVNQPAGREPPPIGVVGMYVGTMAAYAGPRQEVHFFEANPKIIELSVPKKGEPYFTYIEDAKKRGAVIKIFQGKERETVAARAPKGFYKVLVVEIATRERLEDILVELHTKEGMALLLDKLAGDGVLCYHVSNQFLNVVPVLADAAQALNCRCLVGHDMAPEAKYGERTHYSSQWVMIARDDQLLKKLQPPPGYEHESKVISPQAKKPYWQEPKATGKHLWTDNSRHSSPLLRRAQNQLRTILQDVTGSWHVPKMVDDTRVFESLNALVVEIRENDDQTIEDLQKGYEK
jgi:hypothetical protein